MATMHAPATRTFLQELLPEVEAAEILLTEANGYNAITTQRTSDFVQSDEAWWQNAWRDGLSTADDVLKAALAACPDPGSSRGEFESQVFRHLAEDDLDAAMGLLDGMTRRDQDWQKVYAARWWFEAWPGGSGLRV